MDIQTFSKLSALAIDKAIRKNAKKRAAKK